MHRKTVLLLISGLGPGGAERIFHSLAVHLSQTHRVIECVYNLKDQVYPFATDEHFILTPREAKNIYEKLAFLLKRIYRLWKLKRRFKPDVCISQLESCDYLNILTRRRKEKTVCLIQCSMVFNHDIRGNSGWLRKKLLMPLTYRKADRIVAVSSAIKHEFETYFEVAPEKIHVIYNFVNVDEIMNKAHEAVEQTLSDILAKHYCFITAGRLTAQKNQAALISVFAELKKRSEIKVKLFILGDGELRDSLVDRARAGNLTVYTAWDDARPSEHCDVFFLGFNNNPFKFFSKGKWFIFTSLWEGLPLVLVEAMVAGLPIISSDCPTGPGDILVSESGHAEFVSEPTDAKFGILMPMITGADANTVDQWCTKISSIYRHDEVRKNYIDLIPQRIHAFTTNSALARWNDLLAEL